MGLSYDDAVAVVTACGERFETERLEVNRVELTAFRNAPASLQVIFEGWRRPGDETFLVYEDERWTFDAAVAHMDALGAVLVERYGIHKGDRVAIGMRNYPEWAISFAAITSVGAIAVALNAWWTADELAYALEDTGSRVLIADAERVERTSVVCQRMGIHVLGVRLEGAGAEGVDDYQTTLVLGSALPYVPVDPDDDAMILFTSGTAGRAKGAVSTHRAIGQALMAFACRVAVGRLCQPDSTRTGPARRPSFILSVPLFHVTGLVSVMLVCSWSKLKLVIMRKWDPLQALELIEREEITSFIGVPTQSWDMLQHPRFADFDTSSLASLSVGGAPAPPDLAGRVNTSFRHGRPGIGYGMTETNAYGPQHWGPDYLTHPASSGRWVPILEVQVRQPEGKVVPVGEVGEFWFRGPHLIRGYWNQPDETAKTIVDGWLRSGDIGRIDLEGFLYVEDRAKDVVIRGGENVYSAEVEAAIHAHPGVQDVAVFGIPDDRLGELVAAAVVVRAGATVTEDEVRHCVQARLAPFKVPSRVILLSHPLPRNSTGKVMKDQLRRAIDGT